MKKNLFLFLGLFTLNLSFVAAQITEYLGVVGPIEFNKQEFELVWSSHPNKIYYIQEYLPKKETLEKFNQMLTISVLKTDLGVKDAVAYKQSELDERKKTDKICNYSVIGSPDGKEIIFDFLVGEDINNLESSIVEFNVYRYKQINLTENEKAILLYFYSRRSYGNEEIISFLNELKEERIKYLNEMISTQMPVISISEE